MESAETPTNPQELDEESSIPAQMQKSISQLQRRTKLWKFGEINGIEEHYAKWNKPVIKISINVLLHLENVEEKWIMPVWKQMMDQKGG